MADMQSSDRRAPTASKRGSPARTSTRVDLTPMVDLGFLLITFFMLTTVLAKPQVMPVVMPDKQPIDDPPVVSQQRVLTLLLGAGDKVYWYEDPSSARLDSTGYEADGLRRVILAKKAQVYRQFGDEGRPGRDNEGVRLVSKLVVLIKALPEARYKNIVDVFDEMKICGIARYMLLDVSNQEIEFIRHPSEGLLLPGIGRAAGL